MSVDVVDNDKGIERRYGTIDAVELLEASAATFDGVASRIQATLILREQAFGGLALAKAWLQLDKLDRVESRLRTSRETLQAIGQGQPENFLYLANLSHTHEGDVA